MAIQILQDVAIHGGIQFLDAKESFPENPTIGTMVLKGTAIYAYITIGGMETWYPFANRTNSYVHVQGLPNTTWTINHQLHTTDVWLQIKDSNGKIVMATVTTVDSDTVRIDFTTAITGTAVIVAPDSINVPEIKASLISVGPNVVINTNGVLINGSYALTAANIEQQIADVVAIETTARTAADTTLTNAINTETSARIAADSTLQTSINNEVTRATAAEGVLTSGLSTETSARQAADTTITNNLAAEVTRATGVEGTLSNLTTVAKNNLVSAINEVKSGLPVGTNVRFAGTLSVLQHYGSLSDRLPGALYYVSANGSVPLYDVIGSQIAFTEFKAGDCLLVIKTFNSGDKHIDGNPAVVRIENTVSTSFDSLTGKPTTISGYGITDAVNSSLVGANNGIATLDASGRVPTGQLPSYVDDVLEFSALASFPVTGETGKIYVAIDTNKQYRWSGSTYVYITSGAVDSVNGKTGVVTLNKADIGLGEVDNTSDASKSVFSATKLSTARSIEITGDVSYSVSFDGSSNVTAAGTLADSGVVAGTYNDIENALTPITIDSKGRVTAIGAPVTISTSFDNVTGKPTTLSGYGITDALSASDNSLPLTQGAVSSGSLTTSTTTANQVVDTNAVGSVRTIKYLVQITSGTSYQSSEILVIHDGTSAYLSEFGTVFSSVKLADFDADISSNLLRLLVTPVNASSVIKVIKTVVNV